MSTETRAYDNEHGDPVVVLVATGTHDVSRLAQLLTSGNCEQVDLGEQVLRQVRRHNGGRAALQLLAAHGGADFLFEPEAATGYPLTTQHAWTHWRDGEPCPHRETAENARRIAASNRGGYVSVREVTEWRPETTQEQS